MTPVELVLARAQNITRNGSGWRVSCPVDGHGKGRGDENPSVSVTEGQDGRVLVKCHAGCETSAVLAGWGMTTRDLFENRNGDHTRGGGGSPSSENGGYVNTDAEGCTLADYAAAKKLPQAFLKSLGVSEIPNYNGHPAVRIPYLSTNGEEICVRFRVSLDGAPKVKTHRYDKVALYGLQRLDEGRERGYVVAVEGESDTQTLWHHDFPAVGIPGASTWRLEWSENLDGVERVYVVVEPDNGGEQLWERMAASPMRERLYRVVLDGFKDVSELHLNDPERFPERFDAALGSAVSFMDIADSKAQERSRAAWSICENLANEPNILDRFAADLNRCGVAGNPRAGKLIYLALNSRHLDTKQLVNVAVKGPSSAGKSHIVEKVTEFFPEDAYQLLTAMSERALAYSEEPLSHRFLILAEAAGISGDFATYLIRSLLSEGRLRYETVEKTSEGFKPHIIEREGPTGLVVTTTRARLHAENETRMLSVTVDDSPDHTTEILTALADEDAESPDLQEWRAHQAWLAGGEKRVTIPFSKTLASLVPPVAVRLRRDFGALLNLIRSHALLHRTSRERDTKGQIKATLEDYAIVRDLVADLISEGVEATVSPIVRETVEAVEKIIDEGKEASVTIRQVSTELRRDYQPAHRRVHMALDGGYLRNLEERKGRPARLVLGDPLPEERAILPDPKELEEAWERI